jgi:Rrf2 family protein
MFCLSKKTDYALIALAYLAEHQDRIWSAREIAEANGAPLPLLMNILKAMHQRGILRSLRGSTGGYQIAVDLDDWSLNDLIGLLEGTEPAARVLDAQTEPAGPVAAPIQALHYKLRRFLKDVKLSDLLLPGRRIDVPLERLVGAAAPVGISPVEI